MYTERALEDLIEAHLVEKGGWLKGNPADFDAELALTTPDLFAFIRATQPDTWEKLYRHHQQGLEAALLDRLPACSTARAPSMWCGTVLSSTVRRSGWRTSDRRTG